MTRYEQLTQLIEIFKPSSICEIGTWNGKNAVRMIQAAQKHNQVVYLGYDLFEQATAETDATEFNVKPHNTEANVHGYIKSSCPGAEIQLIKGNTRETLTNVAADFTYIDGGHSLETIQSDYERTRGSKIIVLDDFYVPDENGRCPDTSKVGCNELIKDLTYVILPNKDPVSGGGYVQMVMVIGE